MHLILLISIFVRLKFGLLATNFPPIKDLICLDRRSPEINEICICHFVFQQLSWNFWTDCMM